LCPSFLCVISWPTVALFRTLENPCLDRFSVELDAHKTRINHQKTQCLCG
jgi:hypothetical protein